MAKKIKRVSAIDAKPPVVYVGYFIDQNGRIGTKIGWTGKHPIVRAKSYSGHRKYRKYDVTIAVRVASKTEAEAVEKTVIHFLKCISALEPDGERFYAFIDPEYLEWLIRYVLYRLRDLLKQI